MSAGTDSFSFTLRLIGSPIVDASAEDTHNLRNLRFNDEFSDGTMFAFDILCAYRFTSSMSVAAGFHYQDYSDIEGYTVVTDLTNGQQYRTAEDTAGLEHSSSLINIQLTYDF
jgi:outer membrane protease